MKNKKKKGRGKGGIITGTRNFIEKVKQKEIAEQGGHWKEIENWSEVGKEKTKKS